MFHLTFALPALYVLARFVWPLPWTPGGKITLAVAVLMASQYHLWSRLSSGSVFSPEFPRALVLLFNWAFGAILLLALMQIALDVTQIGSLRHLKQRQIGCGGGVERFFIDCTKHHNGANRHLGQTPHNRRQGQALVEHARLFNADQCQLTTAQLRKGRQRSAQAHCRANMVLQAMCSRYERASWRQRKANEIADRCRVHGHFT